MHVANWLAQGSQLLLSPSRWLISQNGMIIEPKTHPIKHELSLLIMPRYSGGRDSLHHLDLQMQVGNNLMVAGSPLFSHWMAVAATDMADFDATSFSLVTAQNETVSLYTKDPDVLPPTRQWYADQNLKGNYTLLWSAYPRNVTVSTLCSPGAGLEYDNDGLIGSGFSFVPEIAGNESRILTIEWGLHELDHDIKTASTFSRKRVATLEGPPSRLTNSLYAVGKTLKSYPESAAESKYGFHYFDDLPFNETELAVQVEVLAKLYAPFFTDPDSTYHLFIRKDIYSCMEGMGFYHSFILSWHEGGTEMRDVFLEMMSHEMVHSYVFFDVQPAEKGMQVDRDNWSAEGIAEFYGMVLPYMFGLVEENEYVRRMNSFAYAYYTLPGVNATNRELRLAFWDDLTKNKSLYLRGYMYFVDIFAKLANSDSATMSLDDLVKEQVTRHLNGDPYDIPTWLEMVGSQLGGKVANAGYQKILSGKSPFVPNPYNSLPLRQDRPPNSKEYKFVRRDREQFDLGFSVHIWQGPGSAVIEALDPVSRAAKEGGVQNGDIVVREKSAGFYESMYEGKELNMTVLRVVGGTNVSSQLIWWPRTYSKVEAWEWIAADNS